MNRIGKIAVRGAVILIWLGWAGVMFYFSGKAWSGAHTLSLLEVLLASSSSLLKLSLQQLETLNLIVRKLAHFAEYSILTWLGFYAWCVGIQRTRNRALLLTLFCSMLYAIVDEIHQSSVPGRSALPSDVLIDTLGVLATCWLIKRLHRARGWRSSEKELLGADQRQSP